MPTPEIEQKKTFGERFWGYAVLGTVGVIAIFAAIDFFNHHIPILEKSLPTANG